MNPPNSPPWLQLLTCGLAMLYPLATPLLSAQALPADFPKMNVSRLVPERVGDGVIFLATASQVPGVGSYLMMVGNDGQPVWYRDMSGHEIYDFKVVSNGLYHYAPFIEPHSFSGGGAVVHTLMDSNFNIVEEIRGGNLYAAESHDFQLLPNGHVLQHGYYLTPVDMSRIVAGGYPNALVAGVVVQELDAQRNVVFQWRSWDHMGFEDYFRPILNDSKIKAQVINAWHFNAVQMDVDGNILVATPQGGANLPSTSGWVKKISRQTGEVLWTLGGLENQFTFSNVSAAEGLQIASGHALHRLPNGNFLVFDNATPDRTRTAQVHEFRLDEPNRVLTRVWSYVPPTNKAGINRGSVQRLPNGNTVINWGGPNVNPVCTEVTPAGEIVFELNFDDARVASFKSYRFPVPPPANELMLTELAVGNSYTFAGTGVSVTVLEGPGGYNEFTVRREDFGPLYPIFQDKSPRVLPIRLRMTGSAIPSMLAQLEFDVAALGLHDPERLGILHRPRTGQGLFAPLETTFNPVTGKLRTTFRLTDQDAEFGEFVFGMPDLPELPLPPLLHQPENFRGPQSFDVVGPLPGDPRRVETVNQERPIAIAWSPKGMAQWFHFQLSTNQDFSNPSVDVPFQTTAYHILSNALPNVTYHHRVKTFNHGGESQWSTGTFRTEPPFLRQTFPNGGESLARGLPYFVTFDDNLAEGITIELFRGDQKVATIATNVPSDRSFRWEIPAGIAPGADYTIRLQSAADGRLADQSDRPFTIGAPRLEPSRRLAGGGIGILWSGASSNVFIDFKGSLTDPAWSAVAGPLQGTNYSYTPFPDSDAGFFRLRLVP